MKKNYDNFKDFENIYLEDSFILEVIENSSQLKFIMEVVLTTNNSLYSKPKQNEVHCYKNAKIVFANVKEIDWKEKDLSPSKDASGEIDYGNIHELYFEDGYYYIFADIGELKIKSVEPKIKYL